MKRLLILFILLTGALYAQSMTDFYQDTLKSTHKTVIVKTLNPAQYYTVTLWTTSGIDTVILKTPTRDRNNYNLKAVKDLSNGAPVDMSLGIVVTTTAKEYLIYDTRVFGVKLSKNGNGATNTVIVLTAKP